MRRAEHRNVNVKRLRRGTQALPAGCVCESAGAAWAGTPAERCGAAVINIITSRVRVAHSIRNWLFESVSRPTSKMAVLNQNYFLCDFPCRGCG